jgi:hypothetical protein
VNPGWSFRDKAFLSALGLSVLWHSFWFFSISVTVVSKQPPQARPKVVSLGPVLDDSIFRTLVETRPELSETFYRRLTDYAKPVELDVQTMERRAPGDIVSLPVGRRILSSIKSLTSGDKISPEMEFGSRLKSGYSEEIDGLEGEVRDRLLLSRPETPALPAGFKESLRSIEIIFEFSVDQDGYVLEQTTLVSTGNRTVDVLWENYLKGWRFEPSRETSAKSQKGKIRFYVI